MVILEEITEQSVIFGVNKGGFVVFSSIQRISIYFHIFKPSSFGVLAALLV